MPAFSRSSLIKAWAYMVWGKCNELRPQAHSREEVGFCQWHPRSSYNDEAYG